MLLPFPENVHFLFLFQQQIFQTVVNMGSSTQKQVSFCEYMIAILYESDRLVTYAATHLSILPELLCQHGYVPEKQEPGRSRLGCIRQQKPAHATRFGARGRDFANHIRSGNRIPLGPENGSLPLLGREGLLAGT